MFKYSYSLTENRFKKREEFVSQKDYGAYLQKFLTRGDRVACLDDLPYMCGLQAGDKGTVCCVCDNMYGNAELVVRWDRLGAERNVWCDWVKLVD